MLGDAIRCTHNGTGGASTLTLAALTGYPQPTDVFGASGTMLIWYEIAEYTDSTKVTLSKYERGIGSLVLSTNVLTRSTVLVSWTSGGSYNRGNPTALSFGNTAANIDILSGASAATQRMGIPGVNSISGDGWLPFNTRACYSSNVGSWTMGSSGTRLWSLMEWAGAGPISQISVLVATSQASSNLRVSVYDVLPSTGGPGNLITEFTASTQIATTATGYRSITLATPYSLPPGFYWVMIQGNNSSVLLDRLDVAIAPGSGQSGSRDIMMFDKTGGSYGAAPATGDTSASSTYTRSGGGQAMVFWK